MRKIVYINAPTKVIRAIKLYLPNIINWYIPLVSPIVLERYGEVSTLSQVYAVLLSVSCIGLMVS